MRFERLKINNAGPIRNKTIEFSDVNLIIGNNEEGKTTIIDSLIQKLFPKKHSYAKTLWNARFSFDEGVEIETSGETPSEEELKLYSLFVVREGDNLWHGKNSKSDLSSRDLWNSEIKEIFYGSDPVYSKISSELISCLGIAKNNSWQNQFQANLEGFKESIDDSVRKVDLCRANEESISESQRELRQLEEDLKKLTEARQHSASSSDAELLGQYFTKKDEIEKLEKEKSGLDLKNLESVKSDWEKIQADIKSQEKRAAELQADTKSADALLRERETIRRGLLGEQDELRQSTGKIDQEIVEIQSVIKNKETGYWKDLNEKGLSGRMNSSLTEIVSIFLMSAGLIGAVAGILVLTRIFDLPLNYFILLGSGILAGLAGALLFAWFSGKKRIYQRLREDFDRGCNELLLSIREKENQKNNLSGQLKKINQKIEEYEKQSRENSAAHSAQELNKILESLNTLREKESQYARAYHSYPEIIRMLEKWKSLQISLERNRKEFEGIILKVRERFSTESPSELAEELKKQRQKLSGNPDKPVYNEENFAALSRRKDVIRNSIAAKREENEKLSAEVQTRTIEGIKKISSGIKSKYLDKFYRDVLELDMGPDIYNIYAFREKVDQILTRVVSDTHSAVALEKIFQSVECRLDTLVEGVLKTSLFRNALLKVTNGAYRDVRFEVEGADIQFHLVNQRGDEYPLENLSTGTRSQVYFAFRLAVAGEEFKGDKGVFLLDDALLTFDGDRRVSTLELLKEYADSGWQIIYVSVNEGAMEESFKTVFGKKLNTIILNESGERNAERNTAH